MQVKNVPKEFLLCQSVPNEENIINMKIQDVVKYNISQMHSMCKYLFGNKTDLENSVKIMELLKNNIT